MKLELHRIEAPFVFELKNQSGSTTLVDASEAIGGKNKGLRPMELLAGSLAACAAIDVLSILEKQRVSVQDFSVQILAERSEGIPSKFEAINLAFSCNPAADRGRLERTIQLTIDKYCSVAASLAPEIKITFSIQDYETP